MQISRPKKRSINGILLLDKSVGLSSNQALQQVKRLYQAEKAGHAGSLDPLASGMLPICFGEATKFAQFLLDADKTYHVTGLLGIKTATGDREGEVISTRPVSVTLDQLNHVLDQFRGVISQIPSMYSALKHQGQPLYKLARQGIEVPREARAVTIHHLELCDYTEHHFTLVLRCSKGTYVRTLIEDMGELLGCGAHVTSLRRLSTANYPETGMHTFEACEAAVTAEGLGEIDAWLLSMDTMLDHLPLANVSPAALFYLKRGQPIFIPHAPTEGWVQLKLSGQSLLGVGEVLDDGRIAPRRLIRDGVISAVG